MENANSQTKFAPAERADSETINLSFKLITDQNFFNKLFAVVPNIILILNKQRQTVFCNQALLDTLGINSYDQILGHRPGEILNCIHSNETAEGCGTTEFCSTCGAVNAILNTQSTNKRDIQECRVSVRKGDSIEALDLKIVTDSITIDDDIYTTFHIMDISDEKRRKILERIFFHDVLNTAGIISGITEIIDQIKEKDVVDEFIAQLNISSHRLIEEIKNQRELLQAESNELEVIKKSISTKSFLDTLVKEYTNHQVAQNRKIIIGECEDIALHIDDVLLGRVISNLIKNALEASKDNDTITVGCKAIENKVEFFIHNPSFIPRDVQLQIFQRSFSTKGANRGIGTYSIKLLTERYLKGSVSFESNEVEGTTFYAGYPLE